MSQRILKLCVASLLNILCFPDGHRAIVSAEAQISKQPAGVLSGLVGAEQAFVCLYLDLQCPASPPPLAAIYPCCMLACLWGILVRLVMCVMVGHRKLKIEIIKLLTILC